MGERYEGLDVWSSCNLRSRGGVNSFSDMMSVGGMLFHLPSSNFHVGGLDELLHTSTSLHRFGAI